MKNMEPLRAQRHRGTEKQMKFLKENGKSLPEEVLPVSVVSVVKF